jgi:hypothetical protein
MTTARLHLETLFVLDVEGRTLSTREPGGEPGPLFELVRGATDCAWAVRADVPADVARDLDALAREEPPTNDFRSEPVHATRYEGLLARIGTQLQRSSGPAFAFPRALVVADDVVRIDDERVLAPHFRGWIAGEIAAGRGPLFAVVEADTPVSICFSARTSARAAEAGVETATGFRGRGLASRVTTAWAVAIRADGRIPLYSTSWTNAASLAVARKLALITYACGWSLSV